jgi:hypothetical protein
MDGFRCLYPEEKVEFDLEEADDGWKAMNVRVVEASPERNAPRRPRGGYNPRNMRDSRGRNNHGNYDPAKLGRMMDKLLEILSYEASDVDPVLTREEVIDILRS